MADMKDMGMAGLAAVRAMARRIFRNFRKMTSFGVSYWRDGDLINSLNQNRNSPENRRHRGELDGLHSAMGEAGSQ